MHIDTDIYIYVSIEATDEPHLRTYIGKDDRNRRHRIKCRIICFDNRCPMSHKLMMEHWRAFKMGKMESPIDMRDIHKNWRRQYLSNNNRKNQTPWRQWMHISLNDERNSHDIYIYIYIYIFASNTWFARSAGATILSRMSRITRSYRPVSIRKSIKWL